MKVRGYRIELGEVEAALAGVAGVRDARVIVREDTPGDRRLVAYGVPLGDKLPAPSQIRAQLSRVLPDYMIPSAFVPVGQLPLTANGKLDRRALPSPERSALTRDRQVIAARTPDEQRVADVWRGVLGVAEVGVLDNFFDLGGDSILAVALVGRLREERFDVAVRDIFEYRTVEALCQFLTGRPAPDAPADPVAPYALISAADRAALPEGVADAYPCSQVQLGMLVEMLTDDGRNHYHNVTSFRVLDERPFSLDCLRAAADEVVRRHEALRTSFALTGYSVPLQLVHSGVVMSVGARDLSGLSDVELDRSLREFMAAERADVFSFDQAPLLRLYAHERDDKSWWISITENHAILEGWSHHSLLMEILDCYQRIRVNQQPAPWQAPSTRYADFIAAELESLRGDADREYWRTVVGTYPKFVLPDGWGDVLDEGTPAIPRKRWIPFHDLEARLRGVATKARVPLKAVLHAAHLKVLSQLTDEPRFFAGLVCNARPETLGADRVYGLHLNPLPFAFDRGARTWRELVGQVFAQEIDLWPHRRFPLPVIQRDLGDGTRLLDVRFSYHDFHQVDTSVVDYDATIDDSPTEFPLAVSTRAGFVILTASPRSVSQHHLDRLGQMYRAVLESMAGNIDGDATEVYLPAGERRRLVEDWNGPAEPGPVPVLTHPTVLEAFEDRARRSPDAIAVTGGARPASYADVDARANRIAAHLGERGIGHGSTVGVLLERGVDLIATLLGVWKTGAGYLPVDPSYPAERVAGMLADAGAGLLVTTTRLGNHLQTLSTADSVLLDQEADAIAARSGAGVPRRLDVDELAYTIFTSGSTGRPKGVQITHRGLANHVAWAASALAARGDGGAPLFSSVAFDLVVPNLWAPLVTGQRVFVVEQDGDLADLGRTLADAGPFSFIKLTPGHLDVLAQQLDPTDVAGLAEVFVVAGEALPGAVANRWLALLGPGRLINEYGPTEASVGTCVFPVLRPQGAEVVPIGRSLPGMSMYVLDGALRPAPIGVTGELYVGGTGVARGYASRPDLTAARFLPDPFGPPGSRLYRTGDLARRSVGGEVEFGGRVDDQVKIRGYRIELGEVRSVLLEHAGVRDAVVVVRTDGSGDRQLVAYHVAARAEPVAGAQLAAHCGLRLPDYMVPATFVALAALPLNANGKVDRRALPDVAAGTDDVARPFVAPRTPLEERIAAIWCAVLGLARVGVTDGFFDIGGHSIRAIALVGALRSAGHEVGVRDVFEFRTVAELARHLGDVDPEQAEPVADVVGVAPFALISPADRAALPPGTVDAYPVSQVQLGMLVALLTGAGSGKNAYHNFSAFRIRDDHPLDPAALTRAVATVIARHEVLRTSFDLTGYSVPLQLVHPHAEIPVGVRDLRDLDEAGQRRAMREFIDAEREQLLDTARPPLMRAAAVVDGDRSWWLALTMNHAIIEGWSHHSLLMETLNCYQQLRDRGQVEAVVAPPVRYADFIASERAALASAADRDYWRRLVEDYPPFALPALWADERLPAVPARATVPLRDLWPALRAVASQAQVSVKAVVLAAHLKAMSQLTDQPSFHSGLLCHGRPEVRGADQVYGMHLNTLPLAYDRATGTWRDLIRQVHERETGMWAHRHFPMPEIQRMAGGTRLIEVFFNFLDFHMVDTEQVDTAAAIYEAPTDLGLHVSTLDGNLSLTTYSTTMSPDNVRRLAVMHRLVLEAVATDLDSDAGGSYLPSGEQERALTEWNDTTVEWA